MKIHLFLIQAKKPRFIAAAYGWVMTGDITLGASAAAQMGDGPYIAAGAGIDRPPANGLAWIRPYVQTRGAKGKQRAVVTVGALGFYAQVLVFDHHEIPRDARPTIFAEVYQGDGSAPKVRATLRLGPKPRP